MATHGIGKYLESIEKIIIIFEILNILGLKHFCDVCGQGFLFQNLLKEHMISHSEDNKPYHCDNCPKTFGMKRYLRAHIRQYHEKPAQCGSCLGTFSTSFKLKEHIQTQHGIIDLGVVE